MVEKILSKYNVTITGQGTDVIMFAHGLGCDQNMWRFITPGFKKDYKLVLFDIIGNGASDSSAFDKKRYADLQGYANDFIEIAEGLELKNITLVAHSVSCMIGLLASVTVPGLFSRIIMIGPSPCYINDQNYTGGFEKKEIEAILDLLKTNFDRWASVFAQQVIGKENGEELSDELKESFCRNNPDILYHFARVAFLSDHRGELSKLKTPTLIIQSSEDIIAPVAVGEYVNENIKGSTLYLTKRSGHCPHLTAPGEVIEAIRAYLSAGN